MRRRRLALLALTGTAILAASDAGAQAGTRPTAKANVARGPVAAIAARPVNRTGPFARFSEGQRDSIVHNTRALLGIRYKWAGETPERGVDCSGLVRYVFAKLGVSLPHNSAMLARLGDPVPHDTASMQPGDLIVFSKLRSTRISHIGIYVGDGMMIHASSTSKQVVETPIMEYTGLRMRGVRRVVALDSAAVSGAD
ncbi:MAG: NlpC/P60 family protein [Gemmatimonadetes bacterium]|nr:NlpC/P60 family protein [Gemmatimonadota bacterium]